MMKRLIAGLLSALALCAPTMAADNSITVTVGSGVTLRTVDVGSGVQSSMVILGNSSGTSILGTAGTANAAVLSVQGIASGTALPISAASLPLPTGAATSANQTNASQKTQLVDGSGNVVASVANGLNISPTLLNTATVATWNTSTSQNTTAVFTSAGNYPNAQCTLSATANATAGAVTWQGQTADGTWETIPVAQELNMHTFSNLTNPYTLTTSKQDFLFQMQGYQGLRANLSTAITTSSGAGTTTISCSGLSYNPVVSALLNPLSAGTAIIGKVGIDQTTPNTTNHVSQNPYPDGATPYTATATGTTAATTATLAGASSVTTYLCGFSIRANASAAATGNATVTGTITATLNFTQWTAPNASGLGVTEEVFTPCIPASGTNQSIAVVSAAPGTGGVVSVTAWGYKL